MSRQKVLSWSANPYQAMSELASLFPTLDTATGVAPWNVSQFVRWALFHGHCSGSAHAVRFLLSVWNAAADWRRIIKETKTSYEDPILYQALQQLREEVAACLREALKRTPTAEKIQKAVDERLELFKPFNLAEAVGTWDAVHRAAVSAWISDPFWT
jgi:hypothetical protein